jgi:hypothetical protein
METKVFVYRTITMAAIIKDEGRFYIDVLGLLPRFCIIYPFGARKLLTSGIIKGAEKTIATRVVAGQFWLTPFRLALYCKAPCHAEGSISRSITKEQS